eukprot:jgi/Tetstr1/457939/TSEL_044457.t1
MRYPDTGTGPNNQRDRYLPSARRASVAVILSPLLPAAPPSSAGCAAREGVAASRRTQGVAHRLFGNEGM